MLYSARVEVEKKSDNIKTCRGRSYILNEMFPEISFLSS